MGYCPYAKRGTDILYLPLPLMQRGIADSVRVTSVSSPLDNGELALNAVLDSGAISLSGMLVVANSQDKTPMTSMHALWRRVAVMESFFLRYAAIPFDLILAYPEATLGGGIEYEPTGVGVGWSGCLLEGFDVEFVTAQQGVVNYSLAIRNAFTEIS